MSRRDIPVAESLECKSIPEPNSGCTLWLNALNHDGYGMIAVQGRTHRAHRVSYELQIGPIPPGLQLDHLCRNRACINPGHLEPVTPAEHARRAVKQVARRAAAFHDLGGVPLLPRPYPVSSEAAAQAATAGERAP